MISNTIITFLLVIIILTLTSMIGSKVFSYEKGIFGVKFLSVLSGSMMPFLEPGDLIITRPIKGSNIDEGDIITFKKSTDILVTHRVKEVFNENGFISFETKGDANNIKDDALVDQEEVVGIYMCKIPKGGYVIKFIRTPLGIVIFLFIPLLTMIIAGRRKST